jgi:LDH2 family malate/lactate/ureidoglycolate dehydrogenase
MAQTEARTAGQWWSSTEEMTSVPLAAVRGLAIEALVAAGASREDAGFIADVNLDKAIQGDHARGVRHLPAIVRAARRGKLDLRPQVRVLREKGASALVDGGPKALARLVCRFAMDLAIRKAREQGSGWVSAQAPGEILTPFVQQAVDAGMVAMIMTQSIPTVAPYGGIKPMLGNAPVAWGVPARAHAPVIIDMSLTQTSASGVALAAAQGERIPPGFLIDERGEPSTDPDDFYDPEWTRKHGSHVARGSLLPLGASHKGYAQVFVVGLLSAVLSGTNAPWELANDNPNPGRSGTLFGAIDPGAFVERESFLAQVDAFIDELKRSPRKPGVDEILYPGERSQLLKRERRASGMLNLPASQYRELQALAAELGIQIPQNPQEPK